MGGERSEDAPPDGLSAWGRVKFWMWPPRKVDREDGKDEGKDETEGVVEDVKADDGEDTNETTV